MSRSLTRRVRQIDGNNVTNTTNETPIKNNIVMRNNTSRTIQEPITTRNLQYSASTSCGTCPQNTLTQRVTILESDVNSINNEINTLSTTVQNHETRITQLETQPPVPPYPYPVYPNNDPYYPFQMKQQNNIPQFNNMQGIVADPKYSVAELSMNNNLQSSSTYPYHPPSRRPPIVFDGYSISYRIVSVNGTLAAFWFLIPETSVNTEVYRFSYRPTTGKYIYEPVDPMDYTMPYTASATDSIHVTYIYENISGYGFGLVPYLYLDAVSDPHTILGFQYIPITIGSSTVYCYVPHSSVSPSPTPIVPVNYTRNIVFGFPRTTGLDIDLVLNYNVVDPTAIDPDPSTGDVNKYPTSITSADPSINILSDIVPIDTGLAFMLPFDSNTYQISFSGELKVSTETAGTVTTQGSIMYLQGSGDPAEQPAIMQVMIYQVDENGSYVASNPSARLEFTWDNICIDSSLTGPAPNNFAVYQEPGTTGTEGQYYKTCSSNQNPVYNIAPILDTDGNPRGRRLLTLACTRGFSFSKGTMLITRLNV